MLVMLSEMVMLVEVLSLKASFPTLTQGISFTTAGITTVLSAPE
jgi:hypothetical protein